MKAFEMASKSQSRPIVYLDMDGVLADFFGQIAKAHDVKYWREIHRKEMGIDQIAQEPGFFESLPPMPNASNLMHNVIKLAGKFSILSSPLLSDVEQSSEEKADWLRKYLRKHQPQAVIFDHEKYKFARQADGTPNILIDDWDTNINLWEANGGIGILYKDSDWKDAIHELQLALLGKRQSEGIELAILEDDDIDCKVMSKLYTSREVLKYVQGIHHEYHMPKPILKHKVWILTNVPTADLKTPEYIHQDDPYRRVIDIDWDHVRDIHMQDIKNRPIVVDSDGWVLDGNHRATAARARGLDTIPALVPYTH